MEPDLAHFCLIATAVLVPVGIAWVRCGRVRWWAVPAAAVGMLFTLVTTRAGCVPALGWAAVAVATAPANRPAAGSRRTDDRLPLRPTPKRG